MRVESCTSLQNSRLCQVNLHWKVCAGRVPRSVLGLADVTQGGICLHLGSVIFQSPARGMRVDHTPGERPSALGTVTPRMVPTNLRLVCACVCVCNRARCSSSHSSSPPSPSLRCANSSQDGVPCRRSVGGYDAYVAIGEGSRAYRQLRRVSEKEASFASTGLITNPEYILGSVPMSSPR